LRAPLRFTNKCSQDKDVRSLFVFLDDDLSGEISASELANFVDSVEIKMPVPKPKKKLFKFKAVASLLVRMAENTKEKRAKELRAEDGEDPVLKMVRAKLRSAAYGSGAGVDWVAMFNQYDSSGDGVLDLEEFTMAVRKSLKINPITLKDKDIKTLFKHLDNDKSGEISVEELTDFVDEKTKGKKFALNKKKKYVSTGPVDGARAKEKRENDNEDSMLKMVRSKIQAAAYGSGGVDWVKMFKQYDSSGDGVLDTDEFILAVRKSLKINKMTLADKEIRGLFKHLDDDGSGEISVEELVGFMERKSLKSLGNAVKAVVKMGGLHKVAEVEVEDAEVKIEVSAVLENLVGEIEKIVDEIVV